MHLQRTPDRDVVQRDAVHAGDHAGHNVLQDVPKGSAGLQAYCRLLILRGHPRDCEQLCRRLSGKPADACLCPARLLY